MVVVWHADKPKYQNEVARHIGNIINFFSEELGLKWFKAGMVNLMSHWNTIDHHRHNKYLYLIRVCFSSCLKYIKERPKLRKDFVELMNYLMDPDDLAGDGVVLQLMTVYIEEIGKIIEVLGDSSAMHFVEPLLHVLYKLTK